MEQLNLNHISTGEPTYWPSDCKKLPDLLDFCVTKGIPRDSALPTSCFDLSSDHSPVLITLSPSVLNQAPPPRVSNNKTNGDYFRHLISTNLTLHGLLFFHQRNLYIVSPIHFTVLYTTCFGYLVAIFRCDFIQCYQECL
jgi:hypothetical protein